MLHISSAFRTETANANGSGLKKQGLAGTVNDSLTRQKGLVQRQSEAFVAKSQGDAKDKAPALEDKFVTAFNRAIAVYSQ